MIDELIAIPADATTATVQGVGMQIISTEQANKMLEADTNHWCLLKMFNINFIFFKHNTLGFGYAVRALKWLTLRPVLNRSKYAYR